MTGLDLVMEVTGKEPMLWKDGRPFRLARGLEGFQWPDARTSGVLSPWTTV